MTETKTSVPQVTPYLEHLLRLAADLQEALRTQDEALLRAATVRARKFYETSMKERYAKGRLSKELLDKTRIALENTERCLKEIEN